MRRVIAILMSLLFLNAVATPTVAAPSERAVLKILFGDAYECSGEVCTEYLLRASFSTERASETCVYITTDDGAQGVSDWGCTELGPDLVASGSVTITLPPTVIILDSGREVTISATASSLSRLPVTGRETWQDVDANGCITTYKMVDRNTEFAVGASGSLTIDGLTVDFDYVRLRLAETRIMTRC